MSKARDLADSADKDIAGTIVLDDITLSNDMSVADNGKVQFGADDDLQIYHDGNDSYITDVGTGDLKIGGANIELTTAGGTKYLQGGSNVLRLYHTGNERMRTTATGVDITGVITTDGLTTSANINFGDNDKAIFGTGSDLQIYHSGGDSYIADVGTGDLYIRASNEIRIQDGNQSNYFYAVEGGGVRLYHGGVEQIRTTASGVDVTGSVLADGLTVDGNPIINGSSPQVFFQTGSSHVNWQIAAQESVTNTFEISSGATDADATNDTYVPRLSVNASGRVGIGTGSSVPDAGLKVITAETGIAASWIRGPNYGLRVSAGSTDSHYALRIANSSDAVLATFNGDGKVGIGTSAPTQKLDVAGTALVENAKLKAIAESNTDTAREVFVYDTRKDSDGGAWRKRTQHTSWYNEALNTATRGARKEFPSVAVIVLESATVTIYDGDEPDMPMWMIFPVTNSSWLKHSGSGAGKAVVARDGIMVSGGDLRGAIVRFVADDGNTFEAGYNYEHKHITTRGNSVGPATGDIRLANNAVNDVDITVLPNAPIDPDTGLPMPTIAVATDGGVNIISTNKTLATITSSTAAGGGYDPEHVSFNQDNKLTLVQAYDTGAMYLNIFDTIPKSDITQALSYSAATSYTYLDTVVNIAGSTASTNFADLVHTKDDIALGTNRQLTLLNSVPGYPPTQSMVAYVKNNYNTGWMNGAIKLAALSDTDTTNISATGNTNLLSGGWTNNGSFPYETFTTSGLNISSAINTTAYGAANRTWTATIGKTYTAYFNLTLNSGTAPTLFVQTSSSFGNGISYQTVNGVNAFTFKATTGSSSYFSFSVSNGVASNFAVANLELYEGGVANRMYEGAQSTSVGQGLSVFGTVTKTAVATGAELVSYSGFSSSNYLQQPYNSNLDFGTGDFSIVGWINFTGSETRNIITRSNGTTGWILQSSGTRLRLRIHNSGDFLAYFNDVLPTNKWNHFVVLRRNGYVTAFLNGEEEDSYISDNMSSTVSVNTPLKLSTSSVDKLALIRISGTALKPEQIKKMYNDEKYLFLENAKATIVGSSNAVTALAYDDGTEMLHVGSSWGRSVFQGLRRVEHHLAYVPQVSISASNGFIVEE